MNLLDDFGLLIDKYFNRVKRKDRKMKRVFQWRRYLKWSDLTFEEKLSAKRLLLLPVFAYTINGIFNQSFTFIVVLLVGYLLYKKFEKGSILKK